MALELGEAPIEEPALGARVHELEGALVGDVRLVAPIQRAQKLGTRRVQLVVAVEVERLDVDLPCLGERGGVVQLDDG